jgi:predicted PurR-regulated permease PerM
MHPPTQERPLANEIAHTVGTWVLGQLKISAILALVYTAGFAIGRLPLWWLIGPVCGALNLIPFAGPLIALLLAMLVALIADSSANTWLGVIITFAVAQGFEGFYLTPRILGRRLSLKPWVVFLAVLFGGAFFGPLGVLFAAPVLAVLMILWRRMPRASPGH